MVLNQTTLLARIVAGASFKIAINQPTMLVRIVKIEKKN